MALVTNGIPNATRHDFARRPTWEVMVNQLERFLGVRPAFAIKSSQPFLFLGIEAAYRRRSFSDKLS